MTQPLTHLGELPIEDFLRDYWQKKPLLIRSAFPYFESPIDGDELAGLALEEEVESRLILEKGKTPWELQHGPFDEKIFAKLPESHWTLLVQAVDQWVPEVHELLNHFRFIPNWRLDDIMISYASDQGSVGPHFDYYDVFLLQGSGKRRWRIGQNCDVNSARAEGTPLNILKDFEQQEEWLLEPGDMLYIPPGVAHWGIAEGESITYSIGFRAPSHADIVCELSQEIATTLTNDQRYNDPGLQPQNNPGEIGSPALQQIKNILLNHLTDETIAQWFGKHMTERKYAEDEAADEEIAIADWQAALQDGAALWRHPAARFAYHTLPQHALLFADGQAFNCTLPFAEFVCRELELDYKGLQALLDNNDNLHTLNALINQESLLLDDDE
jgi:50S ribosomal protein L16 3-hydroxylase